MRQLPRPRLKQRWPCGSEETGRLQLRGWFDSRIGQALAAQETEQLEDVLPTLFGYHLVQIGACYRPEYLDSNLIRHQVVADCVDGPDDLRISVKSGAAQLAINSDCVDVAILSHVLEIHADPHQVLREIDRILVPEGRVVILGFNPWGLWGARKLFVPKSGCAPWTASFISPIRMKDWLQLLGYDIDVARTYFYRPPLNRRWAMEKFGFLDGIGERFWPAFGGAYVIVAKKRVTSLTPIGPIWKRRRTMVRPDLVETRQ